MRMTKSDAKFGAPAGIYQGRFCGCKVMDGSKVFYGSDGKPLEPGLEWQWEITEGEYAGKVVGRITAQNPTTKNSCGTLLSGLVGRTVAVDEDVDPAAYVGQFYQVVVGTNKENPEKTYVTQVIRAKPPVNGPAAGSASPPAAPSAPRPPVKAKAKAADPEPEYWVSVGGGESTRMTGSAIRAAIREQRMDPDMVEMCTLDESSGWHSPRHWRLDEPF